MPTTHPVSPTRTRNDTESTFSPAKYLILIAASFLTKNENPHFMNTLYQSALNFTVSSASYECTKAVNIPSKYVVPLAVLASCSTNAINPILIASTSNIITNTFKDNPPHQNRDSLCKIAPATILTANLCSTLENQSALAAGQIVGLLGSIASMRTEEPTVIPLLIAMTIASSSAYIGDIATDSSNLEDVNKIVATTLATAFMGTALYLLTPKQKQD